MAFGIFLHRTDSIYDDIPSVQYQFPKQYLSRAKEFVGDWIIYLEPSKVKDTKAYFALAKVLEIIPDPKQNNMYLALIEPGSYLDFGNHVAFRDGDLVLEQGLLNEWGAISGRAQAAVRPISPVDFNRILERGLSYTEEVLPRVDEPVGFGEKQQAYYEFSERSRIDQVVNRAVRDRNFRKIVIGAYDERCAVTGLRLINGGGRAEVEAAHIRPVKHSGPDIITNGIALSGTAHWMFDRGLIGLSDDLQILVSRQANDVDAVQSLVNSSGFLLTPTRASNRPRQEFVSWHRENCFKH